MTEPGGLWLGIGGLLAGGAVIAWWLPAQALDWQPALALTEPWRWWTAAFVHWSEQHLLANLGAAAVVTVFGLIARVPAALALAWLAAWPLTHLGLLVQPALAHYGGLSGVLHGGVAVAVVYLVWCGERRQRVIAGMVLAGLLVKLALEAPWGAPLRRAADWDIALAPIGHASGAAAGLVCTLVVLAWRAWRPAAP